MLRIDVGVVDHQRPVARDRKMAEGLTGQRASGAERLAESDLTEIEVAALVDDRQERRRHSQQGMRETGQPVERLGRLIE